MTIYIFGESHYDVKNREYIAHRIREIKPKFILHELLYTDVVSSKADIKKRLNECRVDGICDPRLNKDIYELGLEIDASLIGIDANIRDTDLKRQFTKREAHMLKKINEYLNTPHDVVVVVGDIHLRERANLTLGEPSVLNQLVGKAIIERLPRDKREAR